MGRKARVRAVAALAAGAVPLAFGVGPAGADEGFSQSFTREHTFTAADQRQVTCTFSGESNLFRATGQEGFQGNALTAVSGADPACSSTFVEVQVTYVDPGGRRKTSGANSVDGDVLWFGDDIGSEFLVQHSVEFEDCLSNCVASTITAPK
jgi:hypothetical protein